MRLQCLTEARRLEARPLAALLTHPLFRAYQGQLAAAVVSHSVTDPECGACSRGAGWDARVSTVIPR